MAPVDVHSVLAALPDLGYHGFGSPPPARLDEFTREVAAACQWLKAPGRSRVLERHGSYRVKHLVERSAQTYISNGAAVVAAVLSGFEPVRSRFGPNCRFKAP